MSKLGERGRWFQKLSMIVGATSPTLISSTLVADVNGIPDNPISATTMSQMGTSHLAARLDSIDMDHQPSSHRLQMTGRKKRRGFLDPRLTASLTRRLAP
jgi:hypothetical protein